MVFVTVVVVDMHVVARLLMYVLHNLYFPMVFVTVVVVDMHVVARLLMYVLHYLYFPFCDYGSLFYESVNINSCILSFIRCSLQHDSFYYLSGFWLHIKIFIHSSPWKCSQNGSP